MCNSKQCKGGFPLKIEGSDDMKDPEISTIEVEFQPEFIQSMLQKIAYPELVETAATLGVSLPPKYSEKDTQDEMFLKIIHQAIQF